MRVSRKIIVFLIILQYFTGCSSKKTGVGNTLNVSKPVFSSEENGRIEGKAIFLEQYNYMKDSYVYLYKTLPDFPDKPCLISAPTDEEGNYNLEIATGQYFIAAIKRKTDLTSGPIEPGDYFCYYGGNPVTVLSGRAILVNLNLVQKTVASEKKIPSDDGKKCGIKGKIIFRDGYLENAYAFVFKSVDFNLKGPAYNISEAADKEGSFTIDLPEGKYWLLAKKRPGQVLPKGSIPATINEEEVMTQFRYVENFAGPLETGEYYAYFDENPVTVEKGYYSNIVLNAIQKIGDPDKAYKNFSDTRIEGTIVDKKGNPMENIFAFANKGIQILIDMPKPKFISNKTKKDGKFILNLNEDGVYYLSAKRVLGRIPKHGDLYGYYVSPDNDNALVIKKGMVVKDIVIEVSEIE